ncbi:CLUMA_CG009952, isoform A [Clunio marinus]|uniref:CLUMA_CG009952, isoform A n=1 Tax=Clunio marinus TaxID=568069 RepID=A0A1J1I8R6_9DIPT|nr:CLUMA_CG009952, isoform A [Clunio marinus]
MKTSTTHSYCDDDTQNENDILNIDANKNETYLIDSNSHCRRRNAKVVDNEDDCDSLSDNEDDSDCERHIGDGFNENDTFLKAYDAKTISSV